MQRTAVLQDQVRPIGQHAAELPGAAGAQEMMNRLTLPRSVVDQRDLEGRKARPYRSDPAKPYAGHDAALSKRQEVDGVMHLERPPGLVLRRVGLGQLGKAMTHNRPDIGALPAVLGEMFAYPERDWR